MALVKAGVEFPDGEADMLQLSEDQDSESDGELRLDDPFTHARSEHAAVASVHSI